MTDKYVLAVRLGFTVANEINFSHKALHLRRYVNYTPPLQKKQ
jgi:hypothetical protein